MDSVSRPEFGKIFERTSWQVDFGGATTALGINNRMKIEIHRAKNKVKQSKIGVIREFHGFSAEQLDKLIAHDFAGRTVFEANLAPKGIIAQTLLYGREEGKKKVLAQQRAQVRSRSGFKSTRGY